MSAINTGYPTTSGQGGTAIYNGPIEPQPSFDVRRELAARLREDIQFCRSMTGKTNHQYLLAVGWPLDVLCACDHPETRDAARRYAKAIQTADIILGIGLVAVLAVAIGLILFTLPLDLTLRGAL
jgi:hypothetical protein